MSTSTAKGLSRRHFNLTIAAGLATGLSAPAFAQEFPKRQAIRMVVPTAPGGTSDVLARLVAQEMSSILGQSVVADNKPGAGGNIGSADVARSPADGYTIMLGAPGQLAINQYLYAKPGYSAEKDFVAINSVATVTNVLIVNSRSEVKTLSELIEKAKAQSGKLSIGSSGSGTTSHLSAEMLEALAGIDIIHVPYKGAAPAMNDLLGGQIDMMFDNMPTAIPHIKGGRVRPLGVTSLKPDEALPNVPSISSTLPGYEIDSWFGVVGPAGIPAPIVASLEQAIGEALKKPEVRKRIEGLGARVTGTGSQAFAAFLKAEQKKFKTLITNANIKME